MLLFSDKINILTHVFNQCSEAVIVIGEGKCEGKVVGLTNEEVEVDKSGIVKTVKLSDITEIFF